MFSKTYETNSRTRCRRDGWSAPFAREKIVAMAITVDPLSSPPNDAAESYERFVLVYSPVWILAVAVVQLGGLMTSWGNLTYLLFGIGLALPLVLWPLIRGTPDQDRPWTERYWVRFNLWIGLFTWSGSYFVTHIFFQSLGMKYRFPTDWTFEAVIGGAGSEKVPFFLYLMTQAYFATYHVVMARLLRAFRRWARPGPVGVALAIAVIAYVVAFAETFAMANPLLADYFEYTDRNFMLWVGSSGYAMLFIVSLPMFERIDRGERNSVGRSSLGRWTLGRTALEAMAASWLALQLIDLWAMFVVGVA